jgi:hypothetical protein
MKERAIMPTKTIFFCVLVTLAALIAACGGGGGANTTSPNANSKTANTANTNNPLETNKNAPETTVNNAPTLSPVFKAYCDAWVKGDEAGLRKVYSADTLKQFDADMKKEKATSLTKFLSTDKVSGTPCETRNEKVNGDSATATIVSNLYPNGIPAVFVKENGEWKLTNKSPSVNAVDPKAAPANATK